MGTRHTAEPLQSKIWQLDQDRSSAQGFLYSCSLCDEILVLSKLFINPRKVQLVFLDTCPGCGFELEKTLKVQPSALPQGKRLLTNMVCKNAEELFEPGEPLEAKVSRGSTLLRDGRSDLATGIGLLDEALVLRFGQLVILQGKPSNALSHLLLVRAINPLPLGLDSDVVFVDGGNVYDAYTVSRHSCRTAKHDHRHHEPAIKKQSHGQRSRTNSPRVRYTARQGSVYSSRSHKASVHPRQQHGDCYPRQSDTDKVSLISRKALLHRERLQTRLSFQE